MPRAKQSGPTITDYVRQAEEALQYSWSLAYETDPDVLREAYSSPWNVVKEAAVKNWNTHPTVLYDVGLRARLPWDELDANDRLLLVAYASQPTLPEEEYVFLAQHHHYPVRRAAGSNPAAGEEAIRHAENAFITPAEANLLLQHPLIPYDVAYRQLSKYAGRQDWTAVGDRMLYGGIETRTFVRLLCRWDWTAQQRAEVFHLIFHSLHSATRARPSDRFLTLVSDIAEAESVPPDIQVLTWETGLPYLSSLFTPSIANSLLNIILRQDCPVEILEAACFHPSPTLRVSAAAHSRCPEHAQVAAALLR